MSKPWKPNRQTVELQPSRIRREPPPPQTVVKPTWFGEGAEREAWTVAIGVTLFVIAISFLIFWISDYTSK